MYGHLRDEHFNKNKTESTKKPLLKRPNINDARLRYSPKPKPTDRSLAEHFRKELNNIQQKQTDSAKTTKKRTFLDSVPSDLKDIDPKKCPNIKRSRLATELMTASSKKKVSCHESWPDATYNKHGTPMNHRSLPMQNTNTSIIGIAKTQNWIRDNETNFSKPDLLLNQTLHNLPASMNPCIVQTPNIALKKKAEKLQNTHPIINNQQTIASNNQLVKTEPMSLLDIKRSLREFGPDSSNSAELSLQNVPSSIMPSARAISTNTIGNSLGLSFDMLVSPKQEIVPISNSRRRESPIVDTNSAMILDRWAEYHPPPPEDVMDLNTPKPYPDHSKQTTDGFSLTQHIPSSLPIDVSTYNVFTDGIFPPTVQNTLPTTNNNPINPNPMLIVPKTEHTQMKPVYPTYSTNAPAAASYATNIQTPTLEAPSIPSYPSMKSQSDIFSDCDSGIGPLSVPVSTKSNENDPSLIKQDIPMPSAEAPSQHQTNFHKCPSSFIDMESAEMLRSLHYEMLMNRNDLDLETVVSYNDIRSVMKEETAILQSGAIYQLRTKVNFTCGTEDEQNEDFDVEITRL